MMTRSTFLSGIAIVLLALYAGPYVLLLLPVLGLACFFISRKEKRGVAVGSGGVSVVYGSIDEVTERYGEAADVVVLDASRANELIALMLFYPDHDVVVIAGEEMKLSSLLSVTAKNMATPYTLDEWAVILSTNNHARPTVRLRVGYDGGRAMEIAAQIDAHIG